MNTDHSIHSPAVPLTQASTPTSQPAIGQQQGVDSSNRRISIEKSGQQENVNSPLNEIQTKVKTLKTRINEIPLIALQTAKKEDGQFTIPTNSTLIKVLTFTDSQKEPIRRHQLNGAIDYKNKKIAARKNELLLEAANAKTTAEVNAIQKKVADLKKNIENISQRIGTEGTNVLKELKVTVSGSFLAKVELATTRVGGFITKSGIGLMSKPAIALAGAADVLQSIKNCPVTIYESQKKEGATKLYVAKESGKAVARTGAVIASSIIHLVAGKYFANPLFQPKTVIGQALKDSSDAAQNLLKATKPSDPKKMPQRIVGQALKDSSKAAQDRLKATKPSDPKPQHIIWA